MGKDTKTLVLLHARIAGLVREAGNGGEGALLDGGRIEDISPLS
jgi:hypothetical protein